MANFANEYVINLRGGEVVRLKKGMTRKEVISILGNPVKTENGKSKSNEKLIFRISISESKSGSYTVLFTREELVYIAKR
jgi:hypothetical protein